jgi:hypothetical protein
MDITLYYRRVFRTTRQLLGVGPTRLREGDQVWILAGAATPYALREVDAENKKYQLLGESYVHGTMHGEATHLGLDLVDITLV